MSNKKETQKNKETKKLKENKKKQNSKKKFNILAFIKNKKNIFYMVLIILDIAIIIYSARNNIANYVSLNESKTIFIGDTKNLLFGRNYITLITSLFFYIYIVLSNKILFHQKNSKKFLALLLLILTIFNIILFFIFTKRVY